MHSVEELYEQMREEVARRTGISMVDSCDLAARLYALAAQLCALEAQSDWVRRQCFPQTAQGENLDHHAAMRGLARRESTRAEGAVRFFAAAAGETARVIPEGTVCMTEGLVRFETAERGVNAAGEMWVDVPVRAVEGGAAGNVAPGTVVVMAVAPAGIVSCTNPAAFSGGADREEDESLRARVMDTFRALPNGANAAYYRQVALSDEEVAAAEVVSRPRGVGSVNVVVSAQGGLPDAQLLERLKHTLDEQREIAVDLQVVAPGTVPVALAVKIAPADGYEAQEVVQRVEQALRGHFTGGLLGKSQLLVKLGSIIYDCAGVENYRITAPAADVMVGNTQLPVLESLSVGVMA